MGLILVIAVVILVIGGLPLWRHSRDWGFAPSGAFGVLLTALVVLILLGHVRW